MDEKNSCNTYLRVITYYDREKYTKYLKERNFDFKPEDVGIFNKDEIENQLKKFTDNVKWRNYEFVVELNNEYNVDLNEMMRKTIKPFVGKEEELKTLIKNYSLEVYLEVVPKIYANSDEVEPLLSLDNDIIEFLYKSGVAHDLDYYIY